jgi:hypothetical protein
MAGKRPARIGGSDVTSLATRSSGVLVSPPNPPSLAGSPLDPVDRTAPARMMESQEPPGAASRFDRHTPCRCGSGRRYKHCGERTELEEDRTRQELADFAVTGSRKPEDEQALLAGARRRRDGTGTTRRSRFICRT